MHAPDLQIGPLGIRFLVDAGDSNDTHTVTEITVPPGARVPIAHSHDAFEETFVGLEGTLVVVANGEELDLRPGDAQTVLRGEVHGFRNDSAATVRFLAIAAPGIFGRSYFEELAAVVAAADGPPDPTVLGDVMRRHGLTPAAPA